eukprot:CAMPEP_0116839530 /NCGR_PEP_ID=MMETSP0418-20121206/9821_1 /TAXON_ID=1158023 /ORGANISM="Astrosyne radiata, Strain 13vi08-1A" /LENGTH=273 /DNA_ID=CAMNT_0004469657 /DNA_START=240 /DNA_END=1061 /DNA_ORIENTATION=-
MLYALQGVLQYVSHQNLDPVTFNGLTQTKTLSTALCCWIILKKPQSWVQMVALAILLGSALVFQGNHRRPGIAGNHNKKNVDVDADADAKTLRRKDDWLVMGVIPCLCAAFLSGLAGALSQKGLQLTGLHGRDPFLYTVEVSFYSAVTLWINLMRTTSTSSSSTTTTTTTGGPLTLLWKKQQDIWSKQRLTWNMFLLPILAKAAGGVVTALVHKYAGSVAKGFALMLGLVLSGTIQLQLSNESLQSHQIVGTLMIMLATWLHFTHPPFSTKTS